MRDERRNILLITVDTLRHDRPHFAGNPWPTTPSLDALAARGVVFPKSYSQAGWTLPSIATILTGRYPKDHGATDFMLPISESTPTLAEILSAAGYDTRAFVSHVILDERSGVARGFGHFDASVLAIGNPHLVSTSREITDNALAGLHAARQPFFIWVHYFDPHFDYLAHDGLEAFGGSDSNRYDQEIAFTDDQIGRLLEQVSDDTIVVFTSDHGEEFGEHGGVYHYTLHDEVLRTPLVIRAPDLEPGTNAAIAEQIDLLPTLLAMLQIAPPAGLPGRDLFATNVTDGPVFVERDNPPPWRQRGVILGSQSLWVIEEIAAAEVPEASRLTATPVKNVHPGIYLYDEAVQPGQNLNLYFKDDPQALALLGLLSEHFSQGLRPNSRFEMDDELREKLRSLGYID